MSYNTRQRELILEYIKKNAKKHLTADDIADALKPPYTVILKSYANRISSGNSFSAREKAPAINITMNSNVTIIFI